MKYLVIVIVMLLLADSLSIVVKQSQNQRGKCGKSGRLACQFNNFFAGYPQAILQELNNFRRKEHYSPMLSWYNQLAATAGKEAQNIVDKKTFGQHANFIDWKKQFNSRFFTELSLMVDSEGATPPKRIFAKTIVEALKQEQEWYLIHGYTHAGVAIVPNKKPNTYVVVIHLFKRPSVFHSCKEAQDFGIKGNEITILSKDKKIKVKCDTTTVGGGWTRVLDMAQQSFGAVLTPIDDLGIEYTQILFKAKPNYYFDYAKGGGANANNWDFNGYSFPLNTLRFDTTWYLSEQAATHQDLRNKITPHQYFNKNDKNVLEVIQGADKCFFGSDNKPEFCAKQFVLKVLPKGRLNAISDVESIHQSTLGDNQWEQFYEIYVR